jgi:hypothetical protein
MAPPGHRARVGARWRAPGAGPSRGRRARAARPGRRDRARRASRRAASRSRPGRAGRARRCDAGPRSRAAPGRSRAVGHSSQSTTVSRASPPQAAPGAAPGPGGTPRNRGRPGRPLRWRVKVSTRGDYASRALLSLALHADETGPHLGARHRRAHRPAPALPRADPPGPEGRRVGALQAGRRRRLRAGPATPRRSRSREIVSAVDGPIVGRRLRRAPPGRRLRPRGPVRAARHLGRSGEHMRQHLDGYTLADIAGVTGPAASPLARAEPDHVLTAQRRRRGLRRARARRRSAGSGLSNVTRSPSPGGRTPARCGVEERPGSPSGGRDAPVAGSPTTGCPIAEVHADLVGAPGLERQRAAPPRRVGEPLPHLVAGAGLAPVGHHAIAVGSRRSRPIGASMTRGGRRGDPTRARGTGARRCGGELGDERPRRRPGACGPPRAGPRCPCRGGARCRVGSGRPRRPARGSGRAGRSRGCRRVAGTGMHHQPGRLVDDDHVGRRRGPR